MQQQNIEVIYTRTKDELYSQNNKEDLQHRVDISNQNNCDAFVSIHLNSSDEDVSGFEIWSSFSNQKSYSLAEKLHLALQELNYTSTREIKNQDESTLYVLNNNHLPSVLIELGFITSYEDMLYLGNEMNQDEIAKQLANAIIDKINN